MQLSFSVSLSVRQTLAGPAVYAVKERGQPALIIVTSKLTSFPA